MRANVLMAILAMYVSLLTRKKLILFIYEF